MSSGELPIFDPSEFSGRVRLFPLPNLVLFPNVLQPLHVFEPRYRALTEAALDDDRLIAMAVLSPGWEGDYEGRPPLQQIACLGRIVTHQRLDDGRYNLLLAGLRRIRIDRELPPEQPFREADVTLIEDEYPLHLQEDRHAAQAELLASFRTFLPNLPEMHQQLDELLSTKVTLGMLTDLVAYTLEIPIETKLELLGEVNVDRRCRRLNQALQQLRHAGDAKAAGNWPPKFSAN